MSPGGRWLLLPLSLAVATAAHCGKRGDPLPPLRPVPARITDLHAERTAGHVELRWTIPAENQDGTSPPAVDRVDLFALTASAEAPAPGMRAGKAKQPHSAAGARLQHDDPDARGIASATSGAVMTCE